MSIIPFPSTIKLPDFDGMTREVSHRVAKNNFGDGYTQRVLDGLNTKKEIWQLRWKNIPTAEKDAIVNFLNERAGYQAFSWTAPGSGVSLYYTCEKFSVSPVWVGYWSVSATFEQVYDIP